MPWNWLTGSAVPDGSRIWGRASPRAPPESQVGGCADVPAKVQPLLTLRGGQWASPSPLYQTLINKSRGGSWVPSGR